MAIIKVPATDMRNDAIQAFGTLLEVYQLPLAEWIKSRMDLRLRTRFEPAEIARSVLNEGMHRRVEYLIGPEIDLYEWLRQIASDRLDAFHNLHTPGV